MMKNHKKMLIWLRVLMDACIIVFAYLLAYYLRFYSPFVDLGQQLFYSLEVYSGYLVYLIPLILVIYYVFRLYTQKYEDRISLESFYVVLSNMIGVILFTTILYFKKEFYFSRKFLLTFMILNIVLNVSSRIIISHTLKTIRKKSQAM